MARVAMIASARYPIRRPFEGGLEAQTFRLASHLRARGHDVTLYASGDSDPTLGVQPMIPEASRLDLSDTARADASMTSEAFLQEHHAYLGLMLRLVDEDVDVVHNQSLHHLPIAMSPALPVPLVTTLHTPPTPWLESALALVPPHAANPAFVSVSASNARSWRHRDRIRAVIHNGVPIEDWPCSPTGGDHVVWFGRIVPEKGPDLAIDAARHAGRRIELAGPIGDERYFTEAIRPRLGRDVTYVGHLDTPELATFVGAAGVCAVTPRWEEPYGLVVGESLACGTPVAALRRGAMAELIGPSVGVLAPPDDVVGLAHAIEAAGRLDRRACRAYAEEHCSFEATVSAYEELYDLLRAAHLRAA